MCNVTHGINKKNSIHELKINLLQIREQISKSCIVIAPMVFIELIHCKMHSIEIKAFKMELHIDPKE